MSESIGDRCILILTRVMGTLHLTPTVPGEVQVSPVHHRTGTTFTLTGVKDQFIQDLSHPSMGVWTVCVCEYQGHGECGC